MRILLAEDEADLAEVLGVFFEKNHFTVDVVHDGRTACEYAEAGVYDAIILDVMMPYIDGFTVLRRMREAGNQTPIMMLTARGETRDRIEGFDSGADDYLPKPFDPDELLARVRAMLRRSENYRPSVLSFGDLTLGPVTGELSCGNDRVRLSGREFQFMELFLRSPGMLYSSSCKFLVTAQENGQYQAIFLDCYQQLRAVRTLAVWSGVSYAVCIALVYVLVVLLSRRAIDPVVQASERQKQFITDAGHELKTPITVIGTSLKVLEMEVGQQKWINKARAQTEKLRELVQALITLCKYDEQTTLLHPQPFAIGEAVQDTAESFEAPAQAKGCVIQVSAPPECSFCGDEAAVRQLMSILLDNAVKYAAPDTEIRIALEPLRRGVRLTVENECTQPPDGPLDRLFDRFYRPDASRTAATGGFGIGLSIAKSIAEAHHGSIRAGVQGKQITFTAELK